MNDKCEYAEEYSAGEQRRAVILCIVAGALLVAIGKLWFFPWLKEFSDTAACRTVLGLNGMVVLFYGLFVGFPSATALGVGLCVGLRGYRVLRDGRFPPIGEKVFRKTRIIRGGKAKLIGTLLSLAVLLPLALAFWGFGQAQYLTDAVRIKPQRCALLSVDHYQQRLGFRLAGITDGVVQVGGITRRAA